MDILGGRHRCSCLLGFTRRVPRREAAGATSRAGSWEPSMRHPADCRWLLSDGREAVIRHPAVPVLIGVMDPQSLLPLAAGFVIWRAPTFGSTRPIGSGGASNRLACSRSCRKRRWKVARVPWKATENYFLRGKPCAVLTGRSGYCSSLSVSLGPCLVAPGATEHRRPPFSRHGPSCKCIAEDAAKGRDRP
jgi:hypothetical protein